MTVLELEERMTTAEWPFWIALLNIENQERKEAEQKAKQQAQQARSRGRHR